jgi:restriction endonuclease
LQTRHYKERQLVPSYLVTRVIVETLKQTSGNVAISVAQIADRARTTTEQAGRILRQQLQVEDPTCAELSGSTRFTLAFEAARHGAIQQVARALTWQEFEAFTEECLESVGFETEKGVVVKDHSRRWQIDIIARKGPMVLAVDCKHWESPGYASKLAKAAEHQRLAVQALVQNMISEGELGIEGILALPIVLTLFEPRSRLSNGAVGVSIEQFTDFLKGLSPYSSELPFISAQKVAKSSIS